MFLSAWHLRHGQSSHYNGKRIQEVRVGVKLNRRQFLRAGVGLGGATLVGLAGYSALVEPEDLQVERVTVRLPRLPERLRGLKIAHISDLHFAPFTGEREIRAAVETVNALQPDVVAITGDFVSGDLWRSRRKSAAFIEPCTAILADLRARFGACAVLGNHDHWTDPARIRHTLEARGIHVLVNRSLPIEHDGVRLWLAGVDDAMSRLTNYDVALAGIPGGEPVVLLAHEPDVADHSVRYPIDLQLSGHSHGGQIRIPGLGAPYLPPLARKYPAGLYQIGSMSLYTTRGVGVVGLPFRFACPPEITLIELQARS